jgi:flavin reductase (DIM6/NTAB) family NADH-FMN oxidoreductase RutF
MESYKMKFRDVMSLVPTNVSIISCISNQLIYGCTISSLVSVNISDEFPEILFVLKKDSMIGNLIETNKYFSVNLLNSSQKQIAEKFANNRSPDNLKDSNWEIADDKFAVLNNTRAVMNCVFTRRYIDHGADIFVGNVRSSIGNNKTDGLIYDSRRYGHFLPGL